MLWLNKLVGFFLNPIMLGMILFLASLILRYIRKWKFRVSQRRVALYLNILAVVWIWFWGCNVTTRLLGVPLEKPYSPSLAADLPVADAVIVLGGGISADGSGKMIYPELHMAADRAWHAARIYKAGRAPYVVTTGLGSSDSDRIFLLDLGVPDSAILQENKARNTEEHSALVGALLKQKYPNKKGRFKVLIVTSAWHMRRALLNFAQSDLDVIPAPADHECTMSASDPVKFVNFFPNAESFALNSCIFKEYFGYQLYRLKYLF